MSGTLQPIMSSRSRIRGTAAAASVVFTVTRTSSEPARASSATCFVVAATSAVSVFVIDCTTTGAPPPTVTWPMRTARVARLSSITLTCNYPWSPATSSATGSCGRDGRSCWPELDASARGANRT